MPNDSPDLQIRVLGPVEAGRGGLDLPLGSPRQRLVLAILASHRNHVVSSDRLIDEVWGDRPPDRALHSLHTYLSNLRRIFGNGRSDGSPLMTKKPGYVLTVAADQLDAAQFEQLSAQGRATLASDPAGARRVLQEALGLWRGRPFEGLTDDAPSLLAEAVRLEELRLTAVEDRTEADLALGEHHAAVSGLEALLREHPLRERLAGQLMTALYRSGRQAEALRVYQRIRKQLGEELGIDPSPALQQLEERILLQDADLESERDAPGPESGGWSTMMAGRTVRGYELREHVFAAGPEDVYRAFQPSVSREVSVCVTGPDIANEPEFIRRFESDAQAAMRLEHPHLAPIYDYWREPDAAYLVTRWYRAGTLHDALQRGRWESSAALRLGGQVIEALGTAHRHGVVHGRIEPRRVFLDEEGNGYLGGFAIGGSDGRELDSPYPAPELREGETPSPRSDVYAAGVLMRELMTRPAAVADGSTWGGLPGVDRLVATATAPNPELRFTDGAAFAAGLRELLQPEASVAAPPYGPIENPYRGLLPFRESDADTFFGRSAMVERLVHALGEQETARFLAIVGPSGSGKSSLVRAGLIPALRKGRCTGSENWFIATMLPGSYPFEELEAALLRIAVNPPPSLIEQLQADEEGLRRAHKRVLPDDDSELLLVIDQFEELFTLADTETSRRFLQILEAAVSDPSSRLRVVVTLRADFYDRPLSQPGFGELVGAGTITVTPLSPEELERAIAGPAEGVGAEVEPGLVADIIAEVAHQPTELPLLQYALTETFERRRNGRLTAEDYRATGGVSGALARRAEELYLGLDKQAQLEAKQVFSALVSLGEGVEDTRRHVARADLMATATDRRSVIELLDTFGRHRLFTFDRDPATGSPTVEVAHESLLRKWERLRGWIDGSREVIRTQRELGRAATEWERSEREDSFLAGGARLAQFEAFADATDLKLTPASSAYLEASRRRERSEQRRVHRRRRTIFATLTAATVIAILLAGLALNSRNDAQEQARLAGARELAGAALGNLTVDPELSVLLALEAVAQEPLPEAIEALHRGIEALRVVQSVPTSGGADIDGSGRIATTATDGRIVLWDSATGEELAALDGDDWIAPSPRGQARAHVLFSPDGQLVAAAAIDGSVRVIDTGTGSVLWRNEGGYIDPGTGQRRAVSDLAFSPDGTKVGAIGGLEAVDTLGTLRVWDAATGDELTSFPATPGAVSFNDDGSVVVASHGGWYSFWDSATGQELSQRLGLSDFAPTSASQMLVPGVLDLASAPMGNLAAIARADGLVQVVTVTDERISIEHTLGSRGTNFVSVDFSPDGTLLAAANKDGRTVVWSARTAEALVSLSGHVGELERVAFHPECRRGLQGSLDRADIGPECLLLTSGTDGTARVWDVSRNASREWLTALVSSFDVSDVEFMPDGEHVVATTGAEAALVAVTSPDGAIRRFGGNARDAAVTADGELIAIAGSQVVLFSSADGAPTEFSPLPIVGRFVAIDTSPAANQLAAVGGDGVVHFWDWTNNERLQLLGLENRAVDVKFGPAGARVAIAGVDGTARVFAVPSGELLLELSGHDGGVSTVLWTPDGRQIVGGGNEGTVRTWDAETGVLEDVMDGHTAGVTGLAIHEGTLASASLDQTAKLWDLESGEHLYTLTGHSGGLNAVSFDPEGRFLATAANDGTVRVYLLRVDDLTDFARERLTRSLTDAECRQYLHTETCPG